MFVAGNAVGTGMRGVPPAVRKTCRNYQDNHKCEPATRRVEKSFRSFFPTGQRQTEQAKNPSTTHTNQRKSKGGADPERNRQRKTEKKKRREAGKPDIEAGNPAAALPASSAGAIPQSKGKQDNAAKREKNKKQQRENDDWHSCDASTGRSTSAAGNRIANRVAFALCLLETTAPLAKCHAPNSRKSGRCSAFDTLM
jgi:hypothetical protein